MDTSGGIEHCELASEPLFFDLNTESRFLNELRKEELPLLLDDMERWGISGKGLRGKTLSEFMDGA